MRRVTSKYIMNGKNHGVVRSKPIPMDKPLGGFGDLPIEYKMTACSIQGTIYLCHYRNYGICNVSVT